MIWLGVGDSSFGAILVGYRLCGIGGDTISMKIKLLILVFLIVAPFGCYASYTGIYFLDRAVRPHAVTFHDLAPQISYVLTPFGFRRVMLPDELEKLGTVFSHNTKYGNKSLMKLPGSGANISIAISFQGPSITIRDMSHDEETEFIRAIKRVLEQRLQAYYRLKKLKFEKQLDIL